MLSTKKILASTAIVIIVAPVFLYVALFIQQKRVQHLMKEKLENASLQCIVLNHTDFKWVEENKEIEINGRLFDVKHFSKKDGKIYFTGLYDYEEDLVKKQMADFVNKDNNNNNLPQQQLLQFLFNPAIIKNEEFVVNRIFLLHKIEYLFYKEDLVLRSCPCFYPPPNS